MFLYQDKVSFLHRMHPSAKLVGLVLAFCHPLLSSDPLYLSSSLGLALAVGALGRCLGNYLRMRKFLIPLFIASVLLWALFRRVGEPLLMLGPLSVSSESLSYGLAMGLRITSLLLFGVAFLSTTRIEELTAGLEAVGVPFKAGFVLSLAVRLLPTFAATGSEIVQAQRARGHDPFSGGPLARLRKAVPLVAPILLYALRKTDQLSVALEARGFGSPDRRPYLTYRFGLRDVLALGVSAMVLVLSWRLRP
ncbi:MAG: energy-coupling factor transporter transmembrane protein EcfT [Candidatus Latescibacterota bacterium]|nr:MAG: energy-coupling factor transporter transmembrane protein EcfT [Candidatus Latescibacterota bacterium]HDI00040.1 energy-coupling factor transporter transmembrane protein EcfT [Bacillota bacterium]